MARSRVPMAPSRRAALLVLLARVAALTAVFGSALLVVEYSRESEPAFCGAASGCGAARRWAEETLSLPLPHVGLIAFAVLFVMTLVAGGRAHVKRVAMLGGAGAAIALGLIALQVFAIGALCPLCMLVDTAALVAGAALVALARIGRRPELGEGKLEAALAQVSMARSSGVVWGLAMLFAVVAPFVWASRAPADDVPPAVRGWQRPGVLTVVSFTDFECPFCRKFAPLLDALKEREKGRIHFERRMVPLEIHPGAVPAALAYLCTPEPLRDRMAARLYAAKPDELAHEKVAALGKELGLDEAEFSACLASDAKRAEIKRDRELFEAVGGGGIPLTYVGTTPIRGARPQLLDEALARAREPSRLELSHRSLFGTFGVVALLALALSVRLAMRKEADANHEHQVASPNKRPLPAGAQANERGKRGRARPEGRRSRHPSNTRSKA